MEATFHYYVYFSVKCETDARSSENFNFINSRILTKFDMTGNRDNRCYYSNGNRNHLFANHKLKLLIVYTSSVTSHMLTYL